MELGDLAALERLFAADVTSLSDGNGAYQVSRRAVVGARRVSAFLATIAGHFWADVDVRWAELNGQPAAVLSRGDDLYGVLTVSVASDGIDQVLWQVNPDKLTTVSA